MKKLLQIIVTITLGTAPIIAVAFDPGVGHGPEPRVPQGPNIIACQNEGRQGIDRAIGHGGEVHCEGIHITP